MRYKMITVCDEIKEMGISPEESTFRLYSNDNWVDFCALRQSNHCTLEGTYLPRTLSAHLKQETTFLQLNLFHEYIGHGSFCEHSRIGKRIVRYEQNLAEIEKQILGISELPENVHFTVDQSNPHFNDYIKLRKEFDEFFRQHHNYYEGFAYWLEHHLAGSYGLRCVSDEKREGVDQHYIELSNVFEDFVSKNSIGALLEKMEFS